MGKMERPVNPEYGCNCEECGLWQWVQTPRIIMSGEGKRNCLILGEGPGKNEDLQGTQWVGDVGEYLKSCLKIFGLDLHRDFYKHNTVRCRPTSDKGKNRKPTRKEIKACKPYFERIIKFVQPHTIWAMGNAAVDCLFGDRIPKLGGITKWRKRMIPDYKYNCWVVPMLHPSHVYRAHDEESEEDKFLDPEKIKMVFMNDLSWAIDHLDDPLPKKPDLSEFIVPVKEYRLIEELLGRVKHEKKWIYFDYETTGLNPRIPGMKIISVAISYDKFGYAFPLQYPGALKDAAYYRIEKAWKEILTDPEIMKISHNIAFESKWSRRILGVDPQPWAWDSMVIQHLIDEREETTGLKYQVFVRWGIDDYETDGKKYLYTMQSNGFNLGTQMPLDDLLRHNAIDALLGRRLVLEQKEEIHEMSKDQKESMDINEGIDLFMDGVESFIDSEEVGIPINYDYYKNTVGDLEFQMNRIKRKLLRSEEALKFQAKYKKPMLLTSNQDLSLLMFKILGNTPSKLTEKGFASVDKEVLENTNEPFFLELLETRKIKKIIDYMNQFQNAATLDESPVRMHTATNLHIAKSLRSSIANPSMQNVPAHEEVAMTYTRTGIIPSPGNQILEADFSALEFRVVPCYSKDEEIIRYVKNPELDVHRDVAMDLFILPQKEVDDAIRFRAKNSFVFAEIYRSTYKAVSREIWKHLFRGLKTSDGNGLVKGHLRDKGIATYEDFRDHVQRVENKFWNQFHQTREWQERWEADYLEHGYIEFFWGFRARGYLNQNQLVNYPIQGTAFHILLWAFNRLSKIAKKEGWKTKLILEIHDSILFDLYPPELKHVMQTAYRVMTQETIQNLPWIIVPLDVKFEITEVDGNWAEKKKIKLMTN